LICLDSETERKMKIVESLNPSGGVRVLNLDETYELIKTEDSQKTLESHTKESNEGD